MKRRIGLLLIAVSILLSGCSGVISKDTVTLSREEYEEYKKNAEILENIEFLEGQIEKNFLFEYDKEDVEEGIYKGLFTALNDPYSVYYNEEEYKALLEDTSGEFGGIGVVITAAHGDYITVISPIAGTPGERAGIRAGDLILTIDEESYWASEIDKAVKAMRGQPGTDVDLTIRRTNEAGEFEDIDLTLTRENIKVDSVVWEMIDDLGLIKLTTFDENTFRDFLSAMDQVKAQEAKGVVLDLRMNPGGLLSSVISIADYLLPEGTIVSTVDKNGNKVEEKSDSQVEDIPIVVLIDEGSASASEILAGALQDYGRAKVIGTQSFGKGIVQQLFPVDKGGFKLTVSEYYTPKGNKIDEIGVTPDIVVEREEGQDLEEKDLQLDKAVEVLRKEIENR